MLEKRYEVPVFGVILPGVRAALEKTRSQRIGIIGTSATIRSKAYSNGILARCDTAQTFARACPLLAPLDEEGWTNHPLTRALLREYPDSMKPHKIDTLNLGYTHYPLLKTASHDVDRRKVALADSPQ